MRSVNLLTVQNLHTGAARWYVDGKRVSQERYRAIGGAAQRFDCFHGKSHNGISRQYCCAYLER